MGLRNCFVGTSDGFSSFRLLRDSGDITCLFLMKILPPSGRVNVIGSDIEAELFRQHHKPVVLIGFIGNSRDMVTVDSGGFINIWKYARLIF